ncbi:hypothetical protein EB796_007586 [Bugula neritina]|uniref:Uncharacterized protein n=1 Tax=Bugula neritina TaxID=10212 RepID=A0A7J7K796_BUGNE|nr:hypothetical protein EB796_007586 [Bugula neritina]
MILAAHILADHKPLLSVSDMEKVTDDLRRSCLLSSTNSSRLCGWRQTSPSRLCAINTRQTREGQCLRYPSLYTLAISKAPPLCPSPARQVPASAPASASLLYYLF